MGRKPGCSPNRSSGSSKASTTAVHATWRACTMYNWRMGPGVPHPRHLPAKLLVSSPWKNTYNAGSTPFSHLYDPEPYTNPVWTRLPLRPPPTTSAGGWLTHYRLPLLQRQRPRPTTRHSLWPPQPTTRLSCLRYDGPPDGRRSPSRQASLHHPPHAPWLPVAPWFTPGCLASGPLFFPYPVCFSLPPKWSCLHRLRFFWVHFPPFLRYIDLIITYSPCLMAPSGADRGDTHTHTHTRRRKYGRAATMDHGQPPLG